MAVRTDLFGHCKPRAKARVMMHVVDAGHGCGGDGMYVEMECARCGSRSGWVKINNVTEGRRGAPCPKCNS